MPENPLLPNAELLRLHSLLQRAEAATRTPSAPKARKRQPAVIPPGREALLAGTLLQLRAGDVLVSQAGDSASAALLQPASTPRKPAPAPLVQSFPSGASQLLFAAGLAASLRRAGTEGVVLSFLTSGINEPHWLHAFTWAQENLLPLVVAVADSSGSEAFRTSNLTSPEIMDWNTLRRPATRLKLPILTVDGQDAVAVYRVMQESVLRARSGGGPAVLWAVLPTGKEPKKKLAGASATSGTPLLRLERYLSVRDIALPTKP